MDIPQDGGPRRFRTAVGRVGRRRAACGILKPAHQVGAERSAMRAMPKTKKAGRVGTDTRAKAYDARLKRQGATGVRLRSHTTLSKFPERPLGLTPTWKGEVHDGRDRGVPAPKRQDSEFFQGAQTERRRSRSGDSTQGGAPRACAPNKRGMKRGIAARREYRESAIARIDDVEQAEKNRGQAQCHERESAGRR